MRFSIITPTYNEEKDIRKTLESFLSLSYGDKEIIVVDDSTDKTPDIVKEFESRGVRLIQGPRQGCCEAVNLGMEKATGDIIINADADVVLPKDFLERLAKKYKEGADWVLVNCRVPNTESVFARYVGALHDFEHKGRDDMYYAEAFSCRRELAIQLGMFGPAYPVRFCRDALLGRRLTEEGYKKIYDPSIEVSHIQPDNLKDFWRTRTARGRFGPLQNYFEAKMPLPLLFTKIATKSVITLLRFALIFPALWHAWRISRYSKNKSHDIFPFFYVHLVQEIAKAVGEWEGFWIGIQHAGG